MTDEQRSRCMATRKDGQPCTVRVVGDGCFCFAHSPDLVDKRTQAQRRGGKNRANAARLRALTPPRLVVTFDRLEQALLDVLSGDLEPQQATAAAAVARAMVAVLTSGELEERLRRLEGDTGGGQSR